MALIQGTALAEAQLGGRHSARRKLRSFFFKPRYQIKFGYYMIASGLLFFGCTVFFVRQHLVELDVLLNTAPSATPSVQGQIVDTYAKIMKLTFVGFAGFVSFTVLYSLALSHWVSGPMIAIVSFVEELKKGNYGSSRGLRRYDELRPIMTHLQELAGVLAEKQQGQAD